MSETKKITTTDYVEIMLLEPHGDTYEAYRDYVKCFHNAINESVCNGILKRLINMAVVIEDEPNGIRKIKMLEIYSRTEKELDEWKSRYITD